MRKLPSLEELQSMFSELFGVDVIAAERETFVPAIAQKVYAAFFYSSDKKTRCVAIADVPLAAAGGAALAMVPAEQVATCVTQGELTEELHENFYEVMNIFSAVLTVSERPRFILTAFHSGAPGNLPQLAQKLLKASQESLSARIEIPGYVGGNLLVLT